MLSSVTDAAAWWRKMGNGTWYLSCASIGLADNTWGYLTQWAIDGQLYQEYRPFSTSAAIRRRRAAANGEFGAWYSISIDTTRSFNSPMAAPSTDFNAITEGGFYFLDGRIMANAPAVYSWSILLVVNNVDSNVVTQVVFSGGGAPYAPVYVRRYVGSPRVWETWKSSNQQG